MRPLEMMLARNPEEDGDSHRQTSNDKGVARDIHLLVESEASDESTRGVVKLLILVGNRRPEMTFDRYLSPRDSGYLAFEVRPQIQPSICSPMRNDSVYEFAIIDAGLYVIHQRDNPYCPWLPELSIFKMTIRIHDHPRSHGLCRRPWMGDFMCAAIASSLTPLLTCQHPPPLFQPIPTGQCWTSWKETISFCLEVRIVRDPGQNPEVMDLFIITIIIIIIIMINFIDTP